MQMRQLRDKPFRAFAARVRDKTDRCAFTVDCTYGLKVNYTDHMIRDTLLNGIADDEIRRAILGSADVLTRAVNEIVALVENKEMARNAVPPTEVTSVSAVQRLRDADHRARRNAISGRESNNLPARSKQSRCVTSKFISSSKKGLVVGMPNLIPCVLNAIAHSVSLREFDRYLTTFITPFGRWRYTRAPQGFFSSGDGYNRHFAAVLSNFMRKDRCVDDTVFFNENVEEHWGAPSNSLL